MKSIFLLVITLIGLVTHGYGQQNTIWSKWKWLIGEWKGEGSGQPGKGEGKFTFNLSLGEKILVRKSHSEYPAVKDKPKISHEDLMIVYLDFTGNTSRAIYFDNEGHVINYTISNTDSSITLVSDKIANVPVFRLSYSLLNNKTINVKFEISQDGEKFINYLEGRSIKIK